MTRISFALFSFLIASAVYGGSDNDGLRDCEDSLPHDAARPFHTGRLTVTTGSSVSASGTTPFIYALAGSSFQMALQNDSIFEVSLSAFGVSDATGQLIAVNQDPTLLGGDGQLVPGESVSLTATLGSSYLMPIYTRYSIINPSTGLPEAIAYRHSLSGNSGADQDGDGYYASDAFPFNGSEHSDADNDCVGDNSDAFPHDADEQFDSDGDGVGDNSDDFPTDPHETTDTDGDGVGNNADSDDDGDGLSDLEELSLGTDPLLEDSDSDGLSDARELEAGTDPLVADSDGDTMPDGLEVSEGLDPLDGSDCPGWFCSGSSMLRNIIIPSLQESGSGD